MAGTDAQARVGPDLTHVGSRAMLAAGLLANTPENLRAWLKAPHKLKPGTLMPNLHLTDIEVEQLAAYLETLQ
ncbi:MAG: c-type cytochrome [Caldilineaceae bacterium]